MSKTAKQRELLVALRAKLIGTKHTLPFTIYSDETIEDLLKAQPATLEELTKVKGFPANGKRVAGFGECIVKIFTSTDEVSNITVETSGDGVNVKTELKKALLILGGIMKHNSVINGITLICSVLLLMLACLVFSIRSGEDETPASAAVRPTTEVADEIDSLMSVATVTDATASETASETDAGISYIAETEKQKAIERQEEREKFMNDLRRQQEEEAARKAEEEQKRQEEQAVVEAAVEPQTGTGVLNRTLGTVIGPSGKETFYNLDMSGVIAIMQSMGYYADYWVREDGVKMYGDYIMVAANLNIRPKGTLVQTSLGMGIVVDTGGFATTNPYQLDIATTW